MPGVEVTWEKIKQTNDVMLSYALNQKYSYILDAGNNLRHLRNVKKILLISVVIFMFY